MQVTFQEVVGGARELLVCAYVRALQNFHCAKKFVEKVFANCMH